MELQLVTGASLSFIALILLLTLVAVSRLSPLLFILDMIGPLV